MSKPVYRMPLCNGIEFLEQAMDLFPYAWRVLLTAYADTDAGTQPMNVVDVDPYLLQPWDAREEVKRVASAVGEGAMAVTLVHRYLVDR